MTIYANFLPSHILWFHLNQSQIIDIKPFAFANQEDKKKYKNIPILISLGYLNLDSIQPFAFANITSGSSITFYGVQIKGPIYKDAFAHIDLNELKFDYCKISSIESQAISGSINSFWMTHSLISHMKTNAIVTNEFPRPPYHSKQIYMHKNNITKLDAFYFVMPILVNRTGKSI